MKKTVYKKLGISIIASTLLASQLSTVSALSVISSTGEEYEVSETLQDSPGTNNFSLPNVSPTYGQYYTNQSEVIIGKNDLVKVKKYFTISLFYISLCRVRISWCEKW